MKKRILQTAMLIGIAYTSQGQMVAPQQQQHFYCVPMTVQQAREMIATLKMSQAPASVVLPQIDSIVNSVGRQMDMEMHQAIEQAKQDSIKNAPKKN